MSAREQFYFYRSDDLITLGASSSRSRASRTRAPEGRGGWPEKEEEER